MQSSQPIRIRSIDRALLLKQQPHNRHIAHRSGAMQRQLAAHVLDPRARTVLQQRPADVQIALGHREVQRRRARVGLDLGVGFLRLEEQLDHLGAAIVLQARGYHQRRPPRPVLCIWLE